MGITIDDELPTKPEVRLARVCVCGHPEGRHSVMPGRGSMCNALKGNCPCRDMRLVLMVSDGRVFLRSAEGDVHPLVAGMITLRERGGEWEWVGGYGTCEAQDPGAGRCNKEMKSAKFIGDGKYSILVCKEHA